jgi:hypothetical protein
LKVDGKLVYKGYWVKGSRKGKGVKYWDNGVQKLKGFFDRNKLDGYGKQYDFEGRLVYKGMWKNEVKEGWGSYFYGGGERYKGGFKNDKRNGM